MCFRLQEELRLKEAEISKLKCQVNSTNIPKEIQFDMSLNNRVQTSSYHLAFLFSSPLVRKINSSIGNLLQLDYSNEIKNIEKELK